MSFQQICPLLKTNCSNLEMQEVMCFFSKKQKTNMYDILYSLLEDDITLFFELFGGKKLEIPSKLELIKKINEIKIFNYIVQNISKEDIVKSASEIFKVEIKRIYNVYVNCFNAFMNYNYTPEQKNYRVYNKETEDSLISVYNNIFKKSEYDSESIKKYFDQINDQLISLYNESKLFLDKPEKTLC